eukprot:maker-scaffold_13-snap-gene-6.61-mRNA-1 protein AED:0.00 eAED:0.00 QI:78/1/1/1/1/1/2/17/302
MQFNYTKLKSNPMNKAEHKKVSLSISAYTESAQDVPTSRRKLSVRSIILLILGMILFAGFLVYLLREMQVFQEEEFLNQPTWSPSEKPTLRPTLSPSFYDPLYETCAGLEVGEKMKYQKEDYISIIFVTEVSVEQCMFFLEAAGHVSDYYNQTGNEFFISTNGISFHDIFDNSSIPDVELISPGEQIIDLTVAVGIGPWDGPEATISGASRRLSEGSLFYGSYVGYIYFDILDLHYYGNNLEERVMGFMFFIAGIDPIDSLLEVGSGYKSSGFGIMDSNELFYEETFSLGEDEVFLTETIKK